MIDDAVIKSIDCNSGLLKFVDNSDEMAYFDDLATDLKSNHYLLYTNILHNNHNWYFIFGFERLQDFEKLFYYDKTVYAFSTQDGTCEDLSIIENNQKAFWQFEFVYGVGSRYEIGILTNASKDFIYHFDNQYDFFLLYGELKFIEHVIGCSINKYNLEYLNNDYWFEDCIPSEF